MNNSEGELSVKDRQKMFLAHQTYEGLQITAKSTIEMTRYLLQEKMPFVLTEKVNQDVVEEGNSRLMVEVEKGQSGCSSLNAVAITSREYNSMYFGNLNPYLTDTCSSPGTDLLLLSFKTNLLISSGQWLAFIALHLILRLYKESSSDSIANISFFANER